MEDDDPGMAAVEMDQSSRPRDPDQQKLGLDDRLQSRAYQLEMFEQSMRENTIVADLERLRCECWPELTVTVTHPPRRDEYCQLTAVCQRKATDRGRAGEITTKGLDLGNAWWDALTTVVKRVWFCAPSVVLAQQQHIFLSSQLPSYRTRLITGLDNTQFWSTQDVWDAVLNNVDLVISTPQVLLDALSHGFVAIRHLSLLVLDEAHHCIGNEPMAMIMHRFYHPAKRAGNTSSSLPHILGLTASPITNKPSMLEGLEANMSSLCKTPTLQVQSYRQHVYLPTLERIPFTSTLEHSSPVVKALQALVATLPLSEDPTVQWLQSRKDTSLVAEQKLAKIIVSGKTPVLRQMRSLSGHAEHICESVGCWAVDFYVNACARRLNEAVMLREVLVADLAEREQQYANQKLQAVLQSVTSVENEVPTNSLIAPKAQAVIDYLAQAYRPGITVIIFVKRRSVAFSLTKLLQICPQMKEYQVFAFVGAANPAHRTLVDLADMQLQNEAYADFQAGRRNICVATQVMEEGVDVQATNLVIRYDEPETFRSFVQSRGRARRPDSKYVMVHATVDSSSATKMQKWSELEQIMKQRYSELNRSLDEQEAAEDEIEEGDEFFKVPETGALLTYDNAQQHLAHFCATLPQEENGGPAQAVTIITGEPLCPKSARIILPSSVAPSLQVHNSLRTWRTEKMAKKDAAFQAYRQLHTAKLVNDNLLPWPRARKVNDRLESRDSKYEVQAAIDVWSFLRNTFPESSSYTQRHRIRVSGRDFALPDMIILLPVRLDCSLSFSLHSTISGLMSVTVVPESSPLSGSSDIACDITAYLFWLVLGRRLKRVDKAGSQFPYLVIPDVPSSDLSTWLTEATTSTPLSELVFNSGLERQSYLLKHNRQEIPFKWSPSFLDGQSTRRYLPEELVTAERLSKQLSYLPNKQTGQDEQATTVKDIRSLPVEECRVQKLSDAYGSFMLLMPSVSHMLAIALRGQLAVNQTGLTSVGFSNSSLVSRALTSSSASPEYNFEALEFAGDALLKYYASIHVFFEYPELPEGGLTSKCVALVSNARLQRGAKELGLDAYITVDGFSGTKWTLAMDVEGPTKRQMSSKTLADVIEALIAAAYLDPRNTSNQDELPLAALSQLLPDTVWRAPQELVQEYQRSAHLSKANIARLEDVEAMLGYEFKYKALLLEALTRTALRVGAQSFQRLEFLGDAILDRMVNTALYDSPFGHDPEHLKYRRDALVNRWLLAYLAMAAQHTTTGNAVETTLAGQTTISPQLRQVRLVDHMRTSGDRTAQLQRQTAESTYLASCDLIETALAAGPMFPWTALHSIDTPKSYSDVIESVLGAVFIDSGGSLSACESVLEALGLMRILRRFVRDERLEAKQPIVRLKLGYPTVQSEDKTSRKSDGSSSWTVSVTVTGDGDGDSDVVKVTHSSDVSLKHAEAKAAEEALSRLNPDLI